MNQKKSSSPFGRKSSSPRDRRSSARPAQKPPTKAAARAHTSAPTEEKPLFPMRLNQYLAHKGYATRRGADELIIKGKVLVNGTPAQIGDKVTESDSVEVRFLERRSFVYVVFNKPVGMNTHDEDGGETIKTALPADLQRLNLFPVGRLDKNSHGLIILTNDGRVTDRLLNPKYDHEKTYEVKTKSPLRANFKEKMEQGVNIEGYVTKPCKVEVVGESRFRVTLTEGKTHQVRRMVVALFNEVADLKRIAVLGIRIGSMKPGEYRRLEGEELTEFLQNLKLLS